MKIEKKYYDSGHLYKETYFLDNIVHRDDGPAEICYYPSGKIASEEYYVNGKRHRINGPAYITYEEYGDIISEQHWINDMAHRLDGPAFIQHYEYDITRETYFVNDICLEDFEEYCYYSQPQLQKQKIFEYLQIYPQYRKEVELLARHNNWLNKKELELLTCMDMLT
jgi:antitoxin component YwqK of YwqJK toxin-antitoxin module